jgi:hypothetical protein
LNTHPVLVSGLGILALLHALRSQTKIAWPSNPSSTKQILRLILSSAGNEKQHLGAIP